MSVRLADMVIPGDVHEKQHERAGCQGELAELQRHTDHGQRRDQGNRDSDTGDGVAGLSPHLRIGTSRACRHGHTEVEKIG